MAETTNKDFIRSIIDQDITNGTVSETVHTRFPPEPNGYLHIGHAKSIVLNFGIASDYQGQCNLRFDDTNPTREETEYVDSIQEDIRWLGYDWEDRLFFASDYFGKLYEWALYLIREKLAYVDDLSADEIRAYRGTPTEAGKNSPYRDRSVEENLDLFQRMRAGEFPDGTRVLRARIDMAHANISMRDPTLYRIRHAHHHRTGNEWPIYPTYDYAHGQSDAIEGISHSICTLEFENHRPLYDWFIEVLPVPYKPRQIEFARLNLTYTVMSKRKLLRLVQEKYVEGWDDPRMPTISGLRRRGYTPEAIRDFCSRIGVSKTNSTVDLALLEFVLREDLNRRADRYMAVIDPLKVVITNWPEGTVESFDAQNNPPDESAGTHSTPFSGELYIERSDFMEDPPRKFFRLSPGSEVRLKYAYYITCTDVVRNSEGTITEVHCTYDPQSRGGDTPDGRKVKGTLHWVSARHAVKATVRLYDTFFTREDPDSGDADFTEYLNPESRTVVEGVLLEPALAEESVGADLAVQFLRSGYFVRDKTLSTAGKPVFNRAVGLKDSWQKVLKNKRENEE